MNLTEVTLAALNSRRSGRLRDELRCLFEDCCRQAVLVDACAVDEAAADRLAKALVGTKYAVVVVDGSDCLVVDREKVTTDCSDIRFVDVGADLEAPEVVDDARRLRTLNQMVTDIADLVGCSSPQDGSHIRLSASDRRWNGATVFGMLLGYPAVYYFEGDDYSVGCGELVVNSFEGPGDVSFSYPAAITSLADVVKKWALRTRPGKKLVVEVKSSQGCVL